MRFGSPGWLLLLLLLPLVAWLRRRYGSESAFLYSSVSLVKGITSLSRSRAGVILANLRWVALALFIVALARPQVGQGRAPLRASGIDIVVALDLSGSMLAEDFELNGARVNRVEIARDVLRRFVEGRPSDRIGLVVFAGRPYIACPPTLDHSFLLRNLQRLEALREQGTAIGSAISTGVNRLRELKSKSRILVLMTDGQNNAGSVTPLTAADAATALGVKVYTIGVGTRGSAPYPAGVDLFGNKVYQQVAVDIDEGTLKEVSDRTGGRYYRADKTETLRAIYREIDTLEKTEVEVKQFAFWEECMGYFAVPGLGLLLLEILLGHTVWRKLP
ncbi:MAG: VWA domain-containing protein [Verrucomicrobiota bacterium]